MIPVASSTTPTTSNNSPTETSQEMSIDQISTPQTEIDSTPTSLDDSYISLAIFNAALNAVKFQKNTVSNRDDLIKIMEAAAAVAMKNKVLTHDLQSAQTSTTPLHNAPSNQQSLPQETDFHHFLTTTNQERIRREIEGFKRCSESQLWELMMKFYDKTGVTSWSQGIVPHFITSNTYIAKCYSRVLNGFLSDLCRGTNEFLSNQNMTLDVHEKLYIIELGGGSGKFCFYMLKALEQIKDMLPFPFQNIVYVLTDFTEANVKFWEQHERLKEYVDKGILDFAIFEATKQDSIHLRVSGKTLHRNDPLKNPICILANYLIDTLCHDSFQIQDGILKEGLVSTGYNIPPQSVDQDIDIINNLSNIWRYETTDVDYYRGKISSDNEIHYTRILQYYKDYFTTVDTKQSGASFLIPVGFFNAIQNISNITNGRALIICGDKGSQNPEMFRGLSDPQFAIHGSFSVMVNYHAIMLYFLSRGGVAFINDQEDSSLQVSCFILQGDDSSGTCEKNNNIISYSNKKGFETFANDRKIHYPFLSHCFNDYINSFSPNDFFVLQKSLKEEANPSLSSIVALLKLSHYDPDVFFKFHNPMLNLVPLSGSKIRHDLYNLIPFIWQNYYHLDNNKDIAFEIARLYYSLGKYSESLFFYQLSSNLFGDHHVTFHNMGLCKYALDDYEAANTFFKKSLDKNPSYEKASSWLEKISIEMGKSQLPVATGEEHVQ